MTQFRRFKVALGRTVTLPQAVKAGPGRTNLRHAAGDEFELSVEACNAQQRYIANRIAAGDLVEITPSGAAAAEPTLLQNVTPSRAPAAMPLVMTTGGPTAEAKE